MTIAELEERRREILDAEREPACQHGWVVRANGWYCDCFQCRRNRPIQACIEAGIKYYGPNDSGSYPPVVSAPLKLRAYTSAERNEIPIWDIIANYFPDAFAALARHSKKANDKHNPGEPLHWSRHKSSDHLNKAARHLMTPDAVDPDTGEIELIGALWRCAAAAQLREEARLKGLGIMPLSGIVPPDAP